MTLLKLLEEGHFYEIKRSPGHRDDLEDQVVSYAGSLCPHYNPNMVLLRTNPLDPGSEIYEFRLEDVLLPKNSPVLGSLTELPSNKLEFGSGEGVRQCV